MIRNKDKFIERQAKCDGCNQWYDPDDLKVVNNYSVCQDCLDEWEYERDVLKLGR